MPIIQEKEVLGERLEAASAVLDQLVRICIDMEKKNLKLGTLGEGNGTCRAGSGSDQRMAALLSLPSGLAKYKSHCITQPVEYSAVLIYSQEIP